MAKKIRDNHGISKLRDEVKGGSSLIRLMSFFGLGDLDYDKLNGDLSGIQEQLEEFSTVPDKFNEHFASIGWVAHESMNFEAMKEAVEIADSGDVEQAEFFLVDHFSYDNIQMKVGWLKSTKAFQIRYDYLLLALEDYKEERYHACIPVLLMMTDGAVNDITKRMGFFADGTELTAWDSIAGHGSGLDAIQKIFTKGRNGTSTDEITIPYRHGILHGRDLGYANKIVAAKCWATLFVIRDWAKALDNKREPESDSNKTKGLFDAIKEIKQVASDYSDHRKRMDVINRNLEAWKARIIEIPNGRITSDQMEQLTIGSPEKVAVDFIDHWISKNYGKMASMLDFRTRNGKSPRKLAGQVREQFGQFELTAMAITDIKDSAPAISDVTFELTINEYGAERIAELSLRLFFENDKGSPMTRDTEDGQWSVFEQHPMNLYRRS